MLDPKSFETILIDKRTNGVVLATLNRPERLNAINPGLVHELLHVEGVVGCCPHGVAPEHGLRIEGEAARRSY